MNVLRVSILIVLSCWFANGDEVAFKVFQLSFKADEFTVSLNEFSSSQDQALSKNISISNFSATYYTEFDSVNVKLFNSSSFKIQSQINVEPTARLGQFFQTIIASTYNSKVYSINLDKSSLDKYVNQNGFGNIFLY